MLSGIGPAEHLQGTASTSCADRPGVGRNLQDHLELYIQQELHAADHALFQARTCSRKALIGAEWLFFKTGLGATNHFEAAAFVRSRAGRRLSRHPVSFPPGGDSL